MELEISIQNQIIDEKAIARKVNGMAKRKTSPAGDCDAIFKLNPNAMINTLANRETAMKKKTDRGNHRA